MPEPFKNAFNPQMIRLLAKHLQRAQADFPSKNFIKVATKNLEQLELKQRSNQIVEALIECMPQKFPLACDTILKALHPEVDADLSQLNMDKQGVRGWATMPLGDFVAQRGLQDFDLGMTVLKEITKRGSSEFAVRPFIIADRERALKHFRQWAFDPNYHVRRLVSEGTRPRLPWGMRLPVFVKQPAPVIELLERLKDDETEYVRRSVANNLNDIAKDHPDTVTEIVSDWIKDANRERMKLIRHACRSLIKNGHKSTLKVLGYQAPRVSLTAFHIVNPKVTVGEYLQFNVTLASKYGHSQSLIIDYVVHHRKANGETSAKVFKWKNIDLAAKQKIKFEKKHSMKPVTTRKYYAGEHFVELQINGKSFGKNKFILQL